MLRAILLAAVVLCASTIYSQSCCTGTIGGAGIISPAIQNNLVGLRWSYRAYGNIHRPSFNPELSGKPSRDVFNTLEAFGRYNVHARFHLSAAVPIVFVQHSEAGNDFRYASIGDASLQVQFLVLNPNKYCTQKVKHQLRFGLGLKLPTGTFRKQLSGTRLDAGLQTGTGSADVLTSVIYNMRVKNFGFMTAHTYRINTPNADGYRFGNLYNGSARALYWLERKSVMLLPYAGIAFENTERYTKNGNNGMDNRAHLLSSQMGVELRWKHIGCNFTWQAPLYQHMAEGFVRAQQTFEAAINYIF